MTKRGGVTLSFVAMPGTWTGPAAGQSCADWWRDVSSGGPDLLGIFRDGLDRLARLHPEASHIVIRHPDGTAVMGFVRHHIAEQAETAGAAVVSAALACSGRVLPQLSALPLAPIPLHR
jgi:hypothetical protein